MQLDYVTDMHVISKLFSAWWRSCQGDKLVKQLESHYPEALIINVLLCMQLIVM